MKNQLKQPKPNKPNGIQQPNQHVLTNHSTNRLAGRPTNQPARQPSNEPIRPPANSTGYTNVKASVELTGTAPEEPAPDQV